MQRQIKIFIILVSVIDVLLNHIKIYQLYILQYNLNSFFQFGRVSHP